MVVQGHLSPSRWRSGELDVIRKEAWPFYRTISGVRLYWVLEEPRGPRGHTLLRMRIPGRMAWESVAHIQSFLFSLSFAKSQMAIRGTPPLQSSKGYWSHCLSPDVDYWRYCPTPHFPHCGRAVQGLLASRGTHRPRALQ